MVQRKKPSRKVYRRKPYKRVSKSKPMSKASLALRMLETKRKEGLWIESSISSLAGWFTNHACMVLDQGTSYAQLEGHFVRGRGIKYTGWIKNNGTSTMVVRFGVMCVKQGSSAISTWESGSNVIENFNGNASITTASSIARLCQRWNTDQYRPIRQYQCKLGPNQGSDGMDVKQFSFWVPLYGQSFRYDGSGAYPVRNVYSFYCVPVLANNDESSGENIECSGSSQFYYVDI